MGRRAESCERATGCRQHPADVDDIRRHPFSESRRNSTSFLRSIFENGCRRHPSTSAGRWRCRPKPWSFTRFSELFQRILTFPTLETIVENVDLQLSDRSISFFSKAPHLLLLAAAADPVFDHDGAFSSKLWRPCARFCREQCLDRFRAHPRSHSVRCGKLTGWERTTGSNVGIRSAPTQQRSFGFSIWV
jgi:hypothetical protein